MELKLKGCERPELSTTSDGNERDILQSMTRVITTSLYDSDPKRADDTPLVDGTAFVYRRRRVAMPAIPASEQPNQNSTIKPPTHQRTRLISDTKASDSATSQHFSAPAPHPATASTPPSHVEALFPEPLSEKSAFDEFSYLTDTEITLINDRLRKPATFLTPEIIKACGGGFAALVLGRTIYWVSTPPGRNRTRSSCGAWMCTYRSCGDEIGATPAASRAAVNKLARLDLIIRDHKAEGHIQLGLPRNTTFLNRPTKAVIAAHPDSRDKYSVAALAASGYRGPGNTFPGKTQIYVPTALTLACDRKANAAIVLANLLYWGNMNRRKKSLVAIRGTDFWIWKSEGRMIVETGLTANQIDKAVYDCKQRGFLESALHKPKRCSRRQRHFRLNYRALYRSLCNLSQDDRGNWINEDDV